MNVHLIESWQSTPEAEAARAFFRNVWPMYVHEITGFDTDFYELDAFGRWQPDIVEHWAGAVTVPANLREPRSSEDGGQPFQRTYVIARDGQSVGFVCVGLRPFAYMPEDVDACLFELFLNRAQRGHGVAERALEQVLARHAGRWFLRIIHDNARALAFWSKALPRAGVSQLERCDEPGDVCWRFSVSR